ncbi:unnamed protein product [Cuscuta campestris]|uniref:Uncharacterized protein n=1 Tax=Cuscuta campestris TaxID=132261 RepID=A0A484MV02_9ASTE|nr:unnamed protein product [Cuscuta campestris]
MASSDSTPSIPVADPAVVCFEEMYRQDPSLRPDGLMGGIGHSRVLSAVPLRTSITVASSSRVPPSTGEKIEKIENRPGSDLEVLTRYRARKGSNHEYGLCLVSKVGAREGNSYAVVSSQAECGMVVILTSLKIWKAKFVFISGFSGDQHPFRFELAEAVRGGRPKHGLEKTALGPEEPESEEKEEEGSDEIETEEEKHTSVGGCSEVQTASPKPGLRRGGSPRAALRRYVWAVAEAASLSPALKDKGEILSSLRGLVDGFHKEVLAKLDLISERRAGAEFSLGVDFLASVETELSWLRRLAGSEHEQATELEMQAVAESEEVRSLEAERDRALAEKEQAVAERAQAVVEKERAASDFLQSPTFKDACMEMFADYYDSWVETEVGTVKMGKEGSKWLETGVYHGIQLVLRRARRVDQSFPPPRVDIPYMHDPILNDELGENPDYFGTPERKDMGADVAGEDQPSDALP